MQKGFRCVNPKQFTFQTLNASFVAYFSIIDKIHYKFLDIFKQIEKFDDAFLIKGRLKNNFDSLTRSFDFR